MKCQPRSNESEFRPTSPFENVENVHPLETEDIAIILRQTFELKDVSGNDLQNMAKSCNGLPGEAEKLAKKRKKINLPLDAKCDVPKQNPAAIPNASDDLDSHIGEDEAAVSVDLKLIEVPDFDNYFVRPEAEDALRRGIKYLSSKNETDKGAFVIEGCGGIGKSTLISHALRDPKNKAYFQRQCNLHVFIWLNCYQWRNGLELKPEHKRNFINEMLTLGQKADPDVKDGFKTLDQMLKHFENKKLRILFILDDVFHYSILDILRTECPVAFCCAATRDSSCLTGNSFDPFLKIPDQDIKNPYAIGYVSEDRALEVLKSDFKLKDKLREEQLIELAKRCGGLPLIVSLIGGQFRNCRGNHQYQRTYKKLIEDVKFSNLKVEKTGRGEVRASQLFDVSWELMAPEDRTRYYAFLLFNPVEEVDEKCLQLFWNCDDIEDVGDICAEWERLSLVRQITHNWYEYHDEYYLIHQILHELAAEKAAKDFKLEGNNKLQLSNLRARVLLEISPDNLEGDLVKMLPRMRRLEYYKVLFRILSLIENDSLGQFFNSKRTKVPKDLNPTDYEAIFFTAAESGHYDLVDYLILLGCDVGARNKIDETALMRAALGGHAEIVELLISKGDQLNSKDKNDATALHFAAQRGHKDVAALLVEKGADVNSKNNDDRTALHVAARWGRKDVAALLVEKGANVNAQDKYECTALHLAAQGGHKDLAVFLIEKGADVTFKNKDGKTTLHDAAFGGHKDVAALLIEEGADVNSKDKYQCTALHVAAARGHKDVAALLIEKGADVNSKDENGSTALHLASSRRNNDVAALLIENGASSEG